MVGMVLAIQQMRACSATVAVPQHAADCAHDKKQPQTKMCQLTEWLAAILFIQQCTYAAAPAVAYYSTQHQYMITVQLQSKDVQLE
jgi:hypothetical protein